MDTTPRDPAGHFGPNPGCNGTRSPKGALLKSEFGEVQPLVFGHFGEINERFQQLLDVTAEAVSVLRV